MIHTYQAPTHAHLAHPRTSAVVALDEALDGERGAAGCLGAPRRAARRRHRRVRQVVGSERVTLRHRARRRLRMRCGAEIMGPEQAVLAVTDVHSVRCSNCKIGDTDSHAARIILFGC